MLIEGLSNTGTGLPKNMYRYTDKEVQNDLNQHFLDFGWRQYDPVIARWHVIDPAEQFYNPYLAIGANPVSMIDPDGRKSKGGIGSAEYITPKSYDPVQSSVFEKWRHGGGGANAQHFADFGTTPGMYGVNGVSTTTSPGHWSGNVSNDISSLMQSAGWSNSQMALMDFHNGYWVRTEEKTEVTYHSNSLYGDYENEYIYGYEGDQINISYENEVVIREIWVQTGHDWNASGANWQTVKDVWKEFNNAFEGHYNKGLPPAPIRFGISYLPTVSVVNSGKTLFTGKDLYNRDANNVLDRYILAPFNILAPFAPAQIQNSIPFMFVDWFDQGKNFYDEFWNKRRQK